MDRKVITIDQKPDGVITLIRDLPKEKKELDHKFVYTKDHKLMISTSGKGQPNHPAVGTNLNS